MLKDDYYSKYIFYKKKYLQLKSKLKNFKYFINQYSGNFDSFRSIKQRIISKPDKILIFTTQLLPEIHTDDSSNVINFYLSDLKTINLTIDNLFKLKELHQKYDNIFIYNPITNLIEENDGTFNIEKITNYLTNFNRTKSNQKIDELKNGEENKTIIIVRKSSRPGFYSFDFDFENREKLSTLFKIEKNPNTIVYPFLPNNERNQTYFDLLKELPISGFAGASSQVFERRFKEKYNDIPVNVVYSSDKIEFIKSEFAKLTNNSNLILVGHCCDSDKSIVGNFSEYKTTNETIIPNKNISIDFLKDNLKHLKNMVIITWACNSNILFAPYLSSELKEHIIISSKTQVERLGFLESKIRTDYINSQICGNSENAHVTVWNSNFDEIINFPTKFLEIDEPFI